MKKLLLSLSFLSLSTFTLFAQVPGAALNFDGIDDYVNIPDNPLLSMTSAVTMECWIKTTGSPTGEQNIATKYDDSYYIGLNVGGFVGQVSFYINNVSGNWLFSNATNLNDNNWHHIACTYNGSAMSLYVDGVLDNSFAASGSIPTGTHDLTIGCRSLGRFFQGSIDEFSIWDHALSPTEIQNSYNNVAITTPQTGLVAYYNFNEGIANANNTSVTTLNDISGSSLTGTLNNFDLTGGTISNWIAPGASPTVYTPGAALNFDGTDDYVDAGSFYLSSYTKEAWVYSTDGTLSNNVISSANAPFWLNGGNVTATNQFGSGGSVSDPDLFPINVWTHVAVTYDSASSTMSLYKNGIQVAQNTSIGVIGVAENLQIGAFQSGSVFKGNMDEVRIWNRALCQPEIQNNMNGEVAKNANGLLVYYKFNQGLDNSNNTTITTLADSSGNSFNGTLNNFALTGTTSNFIAVGAVITGSLVPVFSNTLSLSAVATTTNVTCNGNADGIANVTASGYIPYTYIWSAGNSTTNTATGLAPGNYTCTVYNGCGISTTTLAITEPNLLVASSTSGTIACNGGITTVTVTEVGGTSPFTVDNATTGVTAGDYTYTVTDNNGCTSTTTITVTVTQPNAITTIQSPTICAGSSIVVGIHTYISTGSYTDALVSVLTGCDSTVTTNLSVNNAVDASVTTIGNTITANDASATYQWVDCNNSNAPISGETNQSFIATSGSYAVIVMEGTCVNTSTCTVISTTGIAQHKMANHLYVYPNPFTNELTITSTAKTNALLFDMLGNKINEFALQNTTQTISINELAPGMYYLQVDSQKIKIIKQ